MQDNEGGRKRRRSDRAEGAGMDVTNGTEAIQGGKLLVNITEMMVWSKLSWGDYDRNQAYAG